MNLEEKQLMFENRLRKVYKHFSKLARRQEVCCFRFYDNDLTEFPFAIERYGDDIYMAEYKSRHGMEEEEHEQWVQSSKQAVMNVLELSENQIFIKRRQKKEGKQGQYGKFGEEKIERIVTEGGLNFILNMTDYLDTGLFLDHRITRNMVREEAKGAKVLNLFCYTGAFSVYAEDGGAEMVTSVDMSKTYINWAKRNMQYNKLYDEERHHYIHADVLQFITNLESNSYDIIVCDPPTFSNSKRMEGTFDVQRDHVWLLNELKRILTIGGKLYFSNNYRGFKLDEDNIKGMMITDITKKTTPFDFQGKLKRCCFSLEK